MAATKQRIIRMNDENWQQLAERFKLVVASERRPTNARLDSDWQVVEGLRMIASGEIMLHLTAPAKRP